MAEMYDVMIVGSGPAGGSAAFFLTQGGLRVLVLEKAHLPRYKTCGGGLSARFLASQFPFSFAPILHTQVQAVSYAYLGGMVTFSIDPGEMGMVMRDQFDAYLLAQSGAEVRQGASVRAVKEFDDRVEVETQDGQIFTGRYLVGADGANSIVAREAGLRRHKSLAAAMEAEVFPSLETMQRFGDRPVFIFGKIRRGYLWIFPKVDHLSVGIAASHPQRGELQATLQREMAHYGISLSGVTLHGHPIPLYTGREPISTPRILLVGDAAGLVDPLSGEGIRYAIKSGRLASGAILSGHPEQYPRLVWRYIGINHAFAKFTAKVFYHLEPICLLLGAPNPFTTQAILDLLADRAGTIEILLRSLATLPLYVTTEMVAILMGALGRAHLGDRLRAAIYPPEVFPASQRAS